MGLRQIIEIDEERCDGCGLCAGGCPEAAIRIIDGKARLVGESLCDGLGACLGSCPRSAIRVTYREAEDYDEARVVEGIARQGPTVLQAHLDHLRQHGQTEYLNQALAWLAERGAAAPSGSSGAGPMGSALPGTASPAALHAKPLSVAPMTARGGCPGTRERQFTPRSAMGAAGGPAAAERRSSATAEPQDQASALAHWPIQLHLVNPRAPHFGGAHLLIAADCTAFALGSFHSRLLEGRSLVIACPKLDQGQESYRQKLADLVAVAQSVEVAIMEVPCCSGLAGMVVEARNQVTADLPVELLVVGIEGTIAGRRTL